MRRKGAVGFSVLLLLSLIASGCGPNEGILKSGKETPQVNAESGKSLFDQDIEAMRTADFVYVYVLRRKDGGKIDAEDRGVIRVQTSLANRRVSADDDKAFIIGSNNPIPPQNMFVLYERFAVENYSQPSANANVNAKANSNK